MLTADVLFEEEGAEILPTIEFGIIAETGLNVVGGNFETTSRLELVENGRCVWGIWDGFKVGTVEGGGDGLDPSWFWGIGLDCAEIAFPDLEGDNDNDVVGDETRGNIEGINL